MVMVLTVPLLVKVSVTAEVSVVTLHVVALASMLIVNGLYWSLNEALGEKVAKLLLGANSIF